MKIILSAIVCCSLVSATKAAEVTGPSSMHPGLRNLETKSYSPTFTDPIVFANLWRSWDVPSRDAAEKASEKARREMTFKRYGLVEAPYNNGGAPLGMVVQKDGTWAMTCMICHAGAVGGKTILGVPNNSMDFSSIYEDVASTISILHGSKPGNPSFPQGLLFLEHGKSPVSVHFPDGLLSSSRGNFNSFTFSVYFLSGRDRDLNPRETPIDLKPRNHYLDPPPLWNVAKKKAFYNDGFTPKNVRSLMQFSLDPSFGPEQFTSWESDYKEIYSWLHTLESPKYGGEVNSALAARGQQIYTNTCQGCHGTPGRGGEYPNKVVPIEVVNTDRGRLEGLSPEFKTYFSDSWMGYHGDGDVKIHASGYVAPPLDGIWASAPYFHNGSVPTLYHVLFPEERPAVWRVKDYDSYDNKRVGLLVEERATMPATTTLHERRAYYNSAVDTMGNGGHRFADGLSTEQKLSLLEYLKTL